MIQERLYNLASFQRQYQIVLFLSVKDNISNIYYNAGYEKLTSTIDWNNLLSISSILAHCDNAIYLDAALRIAQTCIQQKWTSEIQKNAAAMILVKLTNIQSIKLAIKNNYIAENYSSSLPLILQIERTAITTENSILVNDKVIDINRFQRSVYEKSNTKSIISISAPTSAWKSFILCQLLLEELSNNKRVSIAYIVPTRALIEQVESDMIELLTQNMIFWVNITTVPQVSENSKCNLFIFTQERLHWFLSDNSDFKIDILFIDEAQKINDWNRGILLQQKIEEVIANNTKIKVFFSSPFTSNPELLYKNIKNNNCDIVNTQMVAVNQNLIYVSQIPREVKNYKLELCLPSETLDIWNVEIIDRATTEIRKIALLVEAIDKWKWWKIVYANGAAEAENIANSLYWILNKEEKISQELRNLIRLTKKTVHRKYILAEVLEKRIWIHYGNMPLILREEVERLFKNWELLYLICTSTLLEWVNLPAKTIFIKNPKRWRLRPLNQNDFWNLAWRAWRLWKEFSWNIVCIDPKMWDIPPSPIKDKQLIALAIDDAKKWTYWNLISYISNWPTEKDNIQNLDSAFWYFYIKFLDNKLDLTDPFQKDLYKILENIKESIEVPDYILRRNPWISPLAQQSLLNYFKDKLKWKEEEDEKVKFILQEQLIPTYPEDTDALEGYMRLIGRIGKTLNKNWIPALNYTRAILVINWMKWYSLSSVIQKTVKYYAQQEKKWKEWKKLPNIIRDVMAEIESFVRFEFARDSICYIDILRFFLSKHHLDNLREGIPDLNLWLEFWVNQKSHLSLLSLGLSRNSVIELWQYLPSSEMDKKQVINWLKNIDLDKLNISSIIIADIKKSIKYISN